MKLKFWSQLWDKRVSVRRFKRRRLGNNRANSGTPRLVPDLDVPQRRRQDLRIYYHNAGGLRTKLGDFHRAIQSSIYDVMMETWLNSSHLDAEIFDPEWSVVRQDTVTMNPSDRGEGVLIAVRKSLNAIEVSLSDHSLQQAWVKIVTESKNIFLGAIYIRPQSDDDTYMTHIDQIREVVYSLGEDDEIFILGDFNLPGIYWMKDRHQDTFSPCSLDTL